MPLMQKSIRLLEKAIPKVITPKTHAVADYSIAALFLVGAALFWRRNKRAAIASLVCGVAEVGIAAITDAPGGVHRRVSLHARRKIDLGLSSMAASMPEFLAFQNEKEKNFFRMQSVGIAAVAALTDFGPAHSQEVEKAAA